MRKIICGFVLLLLVLTLAVGPVLSALEVHVSELHGNDAYSGTIDSPFKSLTKARDTIRASKERPVTVYLHEGTYEPLTLESQDSGSGTDSRVTYTNYKSDKVTISAGKEVAASYLGTDPTGTASLYQVNLPAAGITDYGKIRPRGFGTKAKGPFVSDGSGLELFVDGMPYTLARWPNEADVRYSVIQEVPSAPRIPLEYQEDKNFALDVADVANTNGNIESFTSLASAEQISKWRAEVSVSNDVWAEGVWTWWWADNHVHIQSVDANGVITVDTATPTNYGIKKGGGFFIYNLMSELDAVGEFYLNRTSGVLTFLAPLSSKADMTVAVSMSERALYANKVSHVAISGINFSHARGVGIRLQDVTDVHITGGSVYNHGAGGVAVTGTNCTLNTLEVFNYGNAGVTVAGGDRASLTPSGLVVSDCTIQDGNRWERTYQAGVKVSGVGAQVTGNTVRRLPHQALFMGGNDHVFERNHVSNVLYEVKDSGAFYTGRDFAAQGNVVKNNIFEDINSFAEDGANGVYLDDEASGFVVTGNSFRNVSRALLLGGGRNNVFSNNTIYKDCSHDKAVVLHIDNRGQNWAATQCKVFMIEQLKKLPYRSELWKKRYPALYNILDDDPCSPKHNEVAYNVLQDGSKTSCVYFEASEDTVKGWGNSVHDNEHRTAEQLSNSIRGSNVQWI